MPPAHNSLFRLLPSYALTLHTYSSLSFPHSLKVDSSLALFIYRSISFSTSPFVSLSPAVHRSLSHAVRLSCSRTPARSLHFPFLYQTLLPHFSPPPPPLPIHSLLFLLSFFLSLPLTFVLSLFHFFLFSYWLPILSFFLSGTSQDII